MTKEIPGLEGYPTHACRTKSSERNRAKWAGEWSPVCYRHRPVASLLLRVRF